MNDLLMLGFVALGMSVMVLLAYLDAPECE